MTIMYNYYKYKMQHNLPKISKKERKTDKANLCATEQQVKPSKSNKYKPNRIKDYNKFETSKALPNAKKILKIF